MALRNGQIVKSLDVSRHKHARKEIDGARLVLFSISFVSITNWKQQQLTTIDNRRTLSIYIQFFPSNK